jgi:hypothetical protein
MDRPRNPVLQPVGSHPPSVYWVRRAVLLGALLLVVVLVVALVSAARGGAAEDQAAGADAAASSTDGTTDGAGDDTADEAGDASADATGDSAAEGAESPQPEPEPAAPSDCAPTDLTVTLESDAERYADGADPTFTVTFTNSSAETCLVEAGNGSQALVITSGSDRIWSSHDCPAVAGGSRPLLLPPGAQESGRVAWPRVRSDEKCSGELPEPRPGTYTAMAVMGGAQSGTVVFTLDD